MKQIRIEKLTLNIGTGKDQNKLDKAVLLLKAITGIEPVKTITTKRIPAWGLRPGLPIGCKLTLRGEQVKKLLSRFIEAKDKKLSPDCFDNSGNIAFGIHEYIDIPEVKYDPKIGIMGLQVCLTLERRGFRVKRRRVQQAKVGQKHVIKKEEAIAFLQEAYGVAVGE